MAGGLLCRRIGFKPTVLLAAVLGFLGFFLTSRMSGEHILTLYLSYGVMAGLGIGMAYNSLISAANRWFPDKPGFCSGCLMMGFGLSTLILGSLAERLMARPGLGWRGVYLLFGSALGIVLLIACLVIQFPPEGTVLPAAKVHAGGDARVSQRNVSPGQMLRSPVFWVLFLCLSFQIAVGNAMLSFARDVSLSVGMAAAAATALVGVLSVCNGVSRILSGLVFDRIGYRRTMLLVNGVSIAAAAITLLSIRTGSIVLCVVGMCVTGLSYGACPMLNSTLSMTFFGPEYFSVNYPLFNFNVVLASLIATLANVLLTAFGSYTPPFVLLLGLALLALVLNLSLNTGRLNDKTT
jgi:OFA family oxalate/formate antiporter-like MFS transporter